MKRIISFLLALVLCITLSATALAELTDTPVEPGSGLEEQDRVEETKWYYRVYDNYAIQKRLWSITYGKWLTDWITIGYLD